MLPEGWKNTSLMKLADKISDGIHTTPEYADGTGLYFINGNNIKNGRISIGPSTKSVDESEFKKHKKDLTEKTLLISINGTIGNIAFYNGEPVILGKSAAYVNVKTEASKDYIYYFLTSDITQKYFTNELTGSTIRNLSLATIKQTPTPVPPLAEQRKIAEILSTWDSAIAVVEKLIANAKAQKKALMQQLLTGQKRLPGFKGEWRRKQFADAVLIDSDSLGQNTDPSHRFRYISLSDVQAGEISDSLEELEFVTAPSRARRKVKTNDILMATVRPNLQAFAKVSSNFADCIASTGFAVLTAKPNFDADYLYHYLFSEDLTNQIDALVVGSSYPAINSSDLIGMTLHCPEFEEQTAIARVLSDLESLIMHYFKQAAALRQEKSTLMQQLLTGKRRVKVEAIDQ